MLLDYVPQDELSELHPAIFLIQLAYKRQEELVRQEHLILAFPVHSGVPYVQGFYRAIVEILAHNFDFHTSKTLAWRGFLGLSAGPKYQRTCL